MLMRDTAIPQVVSRALLHPCWLAGWQRAEKGFAKRQGMYEL